MVSNILIIVSQVLAVIISLIQAVERPGEGAQKKAEVLAGIKLLLVTLPIPAWAKLIFGFDAVLSLIIDMVVAQLNKSDWFKPAEPVAGGG